VLLNIASVKSVPSQSGIPGAGRKCIAPTALAADADESMIDKKMSQNSHGNYYVSVVMRDMVKIPIKHSAFYVIQF